MKAAMVKIIFCRVLWWCAFGNNQTIYSQLVTIQAVTTEIAVIIHKIGHQTGAEIVAQAKAKTEATTLITVSNVQNNVALVIKNQTNF